MTERYRLDPGFRSQLVQRMFEQRCTKIAEQVDRFEVVANALSHTDQRRLDFDDLAESSGYAAHILKDTMLRLGEKFDLVEVRRDHEGTWYSLTKNPFSPPVEEEPAEEVHDVESITERLYRECCDEINDSLRATVRKLEDLRVQVGPSVGALLMDSCADLLRLREKLTRISIVGVTRDRESYINELREDLRELLKGSA